MTHQHDPRCIDRTTCEMMVSARDDCIHKQAGIIKEQDKKIKELEKTLAAQHDPTADLINANCDEILRVHQEGLAKVAVQVEYLLDILGRINFHPSEAVNLIDRGILLQRIIEAVKAFHPMHAETWKGFPK